MLLWRHCGGGDRRAAWSKENNLAGNYHYEHRCYSPDHRILGSADDRGTVSSIGLRNLAAHANNCSVIAGIGNGLNTATAPVWQGETSKASWRGKLIVIEMIMNIAGFSLSNWITYGFSFVGGPVAWRVPLAFQFLFIVILYATVPWLPESPRWLIAKGRIEEADQILADLEGATPDDPYVVTESKEIQYAVTYERENAPAWKDLLRGKTGPEAGTCTMRRLFLGMGTQAMQQLSGINVSLVIQ